MAGSCFDGAFMHDDELRFTHSKALVSAARQNERTTSGLWRLLAGRSPSCHAFGVGLSASCHRRRLALATEVFEELRETFELWEESDLCKVTWAYGRHQVKMADGSVYAVKSATGKKHGGTWDVLL